MGVVSAGIRASTANCGRPMGLEMRLHFLERRRRTASTLLALGSITGTIPSMGRFAAFVPTSLVDGRVESLLKWRWLILIVGFVSTVSFEIAEGH